MQPGRRGSLGSQAQLPAGSARLQGPCAAAVLQLWQELGPYVTCAIYLQARCMLQARRLTQSSQEGVSQYFFISAVPDCLRASRFVVVDAIGRSSSHMFFQLEKGCLAGLCHRLLLPLLVAHPPTVTSLSWAFETP